MILALRLRKLLVINVENNFDVENSRLLSLSHSPSHYLTLSFTHSLSTCWTTFVFMSMIKSHCLWLFVMSCSHAVMSCCHMSSAYVDHWDMLNNFCFHVYAQKSLFMIVCHAVMLSCHAVMLPYVKCLWRSVRSGLNWKDMRGKNSDGHKNDGSEYSDGSTSCHTSYQHKRMANLTFRHLWMKLFQLMPRFQGVFGQFSLPLFSAMFRILWIWG